MKTISVPDIGDFKDVEVIEVLIRPGGVVAVEESLIVLESDKATMDIPSPFAGTIAAVHIAAGDKVNVGDKIADIKESAAVADPDSPPPADSAVDSASDSVVDSMADSASDSAADSLSSVASAKELTDPPPAGSDPPAAKTVAAPDSPSPAASTVTDSPPVVVEVVVPDIGDFEAVEVIEVFVAVGGFVAADESLIALESDKATMDVPSPFAGEVREILIKTGDKVSAGKLIARLMTTASADSNSAPARKESAATAPSDSSSATPSQKPPSESPSQLSTKTAATSPPLTPVVEKAGQYAKVYAGPAVRRFAREVGADLSQVIGGGRHGRIVRADVKQFIKTKLAAKNEGRGFLPEMAETDFSKFGEVEIHPQSRIRKLSAANLHRNWLLAPHITQFHQADVTDLENFRRSLADEKRDYKITMVAFLIKAAVMALRQMPRFNSSLQGDNLAMKKYFNIGVAVDTPSGLMVPVLRNVDKMGLSDIAKSLAEISGRARDGKLKSEDMQGGCFTISSLGGIGGGFFTPIINLPEVAILGVARAQLLPQWNGKEFLPRLMLPLALSYDHRVIDGVAGAKFITHYGELLSDTRRLAL